MTEYKATNKPYKTLVFHYPSFQTASDSQDSYLLHWSQGPLSVSRSYFPFGSLENRVGNA